MPVGIRERPLRVDGSPRADHDVGDERHARPAAGGVHRWLRALLEEVVAESVDVASSTRYAY